MEILDLPTPDAYARFLLACPLPVDHFMENHSTAAVRRALENLLKEVDATYDEAINRIEGQATDDRASKRISCLDYLCPRPLNVK
jgi:hypothetical protein